LLLWLLLLLLLVGPLVVPVLCEGRDKEGWVGGVMIEIWEERERGEGQPSEGGRRSKG